MNDSKTRSIRILKSVVIGDGGVGKSSLMNRFVNNNFDGQCFHTIGVEFLNKDIELHGQTYTLQIWDTAGQERFRSLRTPFYRGADCCLLVFSVDNRKSFENLESWISEFARYADVPDMANFPFVVIGNKLDVPDRAVSESEAREWCEQNQKIAYYETSAKESVGVQHAFLAAAQKAILADSIISPDFNETIRLSSTSNNANVQKNSSKCC